METIDIAAWMPGILAFIVLQVFAFFINILSNGATPVAARIVKMAGTHWKDQRKNASLEALALVIASQAFPYREIVRVIFFATGLILSLVLMSLVILRRLYQVASGDNGFWWGSPIGDIIGVTRADTILTVVLMLLTAMMMYSMSSRMELLLNPNHLSRRILRRLQVLGVPQDEAWHQAQEIANQRLFRGPNAGAETEAGRAEA